MWIRGSLLSQTVLDIEGAPVGQIVDTYPCDGSSPEFAIVRMNRFGERVMVDLAGIRRTPDAIQFPFTRAEIEDAPTLECARYQCDRISIARTYWLLNGSGEKLGIL